MELMTKEIEKELEKYPFYSQQELNGDAKVIVKYFNPVGASTWLITEGEKQADGDYLLYGYCLLNDPRFAELGYVSLNELKDIKLPYGLGIERDLYCPKNMTLYEGIKRLGIEVPEHLIPENKLKDLKKDYALEK